MVTFNQEAKPQSSSDVSLLKIASNYLVSLKLANPPEIHFVSLPDIKEARVDEFLGGPTCLYFNLDFFIGMNEIYAQLIIIHEIYHFVKQGLIGIHCVTNLRDSHLWSLMQISDIEADVETAIYLSACGVLRSFDYYVEILHQGAKTFRDKKMRFVKLERFIGSLLSIRHVLETGDRIVYLPFLHCDTILITSINYCNKNLNFQWLPLNYETLSHWKIVFQDACLLDETTYVREINQLTADLLNAIQ